MCIRDRNDVVIYKNDKNGNQLATVNRSEITAEAKDTSYIDVDVTPVSYTHLDKFKDKENQIIFCKTCNIFF